MSGFAKPDPDFTLSPSLTDALRARIAELEAKLSREKESAEIANQQWSEWMTKARAFDALIAVKEEEAETCIVALEKRVQQAETELAVADDRYKAMVKNVAGYEATIEAMRGQYTDLMAQLAACDATPSHVLRLEAFHRAVMHHWTCAPDDPRRYRHVLRALLDAIEDAHDEVES